MLLDKLESRTIVTGNIIALKPLHIGMSEEGTDPVQVDSPVIKDARRQPLIPGSSLKGVLRSRLEAILSNPAFKNQWHSCNIVAEADNCNERIRDILKQYDQEHEKKNFEEMARLVYDHSCDVCKLLGNQHMAARLQIKDMYYTGDSPDTERRDGVGIDRDSGIAFPGAKYSYEIVPAGTRFDFYMVAENLAENQSKLLYLIIKLLEDGEISVGGKTSRGLGQIRLEFPAGKKAESILEINRDNIRKHYGLE